MINSFSYLCITLNETNTLYIYTWSDVETSTKNVDRFLSSPLEVKLFRGIPLCTLIVVTPPLFYPPPFLLIHLDPSLQQKCYTFCHARLSVIDLILCNR